MSHQPYFQAPYRRRLASSSFQHCQKHPLTSDRLQAIAQDLRTRPADFIEPANRGRITSDSIRAIADDIDNIGNLLSTPDLRSFLRERGRIVTPALLGGACPAEQYDQAWMRKF